MRFRWQPGYAERSEMMPTMEGVMGSAAASHHGSFAQSWRSRRAERTPPAANGFTCESPRQDNHALP